MENPRKSEANPVASGRKGRISDVPTSATRHVAARLNPLPRIRSSSKSLDPPSRRADAPSQTKAMSMSTVAHSLNALVVDGAQREAKDTFHGKEKLKKNHVKIEMNECSKTKGVNMQMMTMRRRSYCSSKIELADFLSCNGVRVVAADMPPFMQIHAVDCARKAHDSLEKFSSKTLALSMKKEFDGVYGPAWHCIVGTSFGSFVTHSIGGFLYFSMDRKLYVLLFKTTVQRVD